MIQKTIDILRTRKTDTLLVMCIVLFCHLLLTLIWPLAAFFDLGEIVFLKGLMLLFSFGLIAVPLILFSGFERLLVFSPHSSLSLKNSIKVGSKYFLRILSFFALLFGSVILLGFLLGLFASLLNGHIIDNTYNQLCFNAAFLLLLKYAYLVPAQIIVHDRSLKDSIIYTRYYHGKAINLFVLLCVAVHVLILTTSSIVFIYVSYGSLSYVVFMACKTIIETPVFLFLGLMAVLHVDACSSEKQTCRRNFIYNTLVESLNDTKSN